MKTRILTGVPAALALLALILWGPNGLLRSVTIVFSALAYWEFDSLMFHRKSLFRKGFVATLLGIQIFLLGFDSVLAFHFWILSTVLLLMGGVLGEARKGHFQNAIQETSTQWLGFGYVSLLFGFLYNIVSWPQMGRHYLLFLFLLVFLGDTAAYFVGTKFGKRKLASEISPKKTIEGASGAILTCVITAVAWCIFLLPGGLSSPDAWKLIAFAPFLSVLAQLGDLFESVLKRSQSQKDSGAFLPGHGGILDRIDGLVFSSPIFYLFIYFFLEDF